MHKYSQRACAREKGILVGVRAQIQISKQRKRVAVVWVAVCMKCMRASERSVEYTCKRESVNELCLTVVCSCCLEVWVRGEGERQLGD